MNKNEFETIFTPTNRYNEDATYIATLEKIEEVIKKDKGHCEEYYIDSIYFDQSRWKFEVEILVTLPEDAKKWNYNEVNPITEYYSVDDILLLINK